MTGPGPDTLDDFTVTPDAFTGVSVSDLVRHWARTHGDEPAYISPDGATTWAAYDLAADRMYAALRSGPGGQQPPESVAVYLPDTVGFHVALVGAYRAGVRVAAMGARSGPAEVAHIMASAGARVLVTAPQVRGVPVENLLADLRGRGTAIDRVLLVDDTTIVEVGSEVGATADAAGDQGGADDLGATADGPDSTAPGHPVPVDPRHSFGVDEVSMLNSTSGTTGRPKLVTQTQRRWTAFAALACRNAELTRQETVAAFVPAPFGFGLWTSHFLPALLGRTALVMERFDAATAITMMREHRATVLACVSTQFRMMLHCSQPPLGSVHDLRVMFTGGEAVPFAEAKRFEDVTGAKSLQFYGSNETGAASATTIHDDDETRLSTGGRIIPEMRVRVFDGGREVTGPGLRRGQPAVRGVLTSPGYWNDPEANAELFTDDGWVLLGDVVEIDESDRLRVVGRLADLIIRGGKNISAVEVEDHVREHPAVAMVAAVGVPDPIFGERLCVVVTLEPGAEAITLAELTDWLRTHGVTREYLPEKLLVVEALPTAPGGKIAKGEVRELAQASMSDGGGPRVATT
ncbi:acyl--CoA ligase [Dietzia sp. ANT_WB102]|nr:acyl--CoA ligase [Dietzia sp. ANT_WB102]